MNTLLETSLGLALVYLLVCMLVSGMQELIARYRNKRGQFLREGLVSLIADRWVYLRTINHPSIVAFYRYVPGKGPMPSYLPANAIAQALCDVLVRRHQLHVPGGGQVVFDLDAIKAAVRHAKERDSTLGQALLPPVEGATTLDEALAGVARWVEQGMERVSGWYKAHTQKQMFIIGLLVAVMLNIDSIAIVQAMARAPALRAEMAVMAEQLAAANKAGQSESPDARQQIKDSHARLQDLAAKGLPVGYACLGTQTRCNPCDVDSWLLKIVGLVITALAASLGAPFWFGLINRVVDLRGSGIKPK